MDARGILAVELFDRRGAPKRRDTWFVYGLVDSRRPDEIRYIGITNNPAGRLRCHISTSSKCSTHKARWINSTVRGGADILVGILRSDLSHDAAKAEEVSLISLMDGLTNLTEGGDGTSGYAHTEISKTKMRDAALGRIISNETREKISFAHTGAKRPAETGLRISRSKIGKPRPKSVGIAVGNAHRGRPLSFDHRVKLSAAQQLIATRPNDSGIRASVQRLAGPKSNNKSGFKGVIWDKKSNKWRAQLNKDGSGHTVVGYFPTPELAAKAYDAAAYAAWGSDCYLNFPSLIQQEVSNG